MSKQGYVYLFQGNDGVYKIGKSNNVKRRLSQLRGEYSHDLKLVYAFYSEDAFKWESYWHRQFITWQLDEGRDWFYLFTSHVIEFCSTPLLVPSKPPRRNLKAEGSRRFLAHLARSVIRNQIPAAA